MITKQCPQCKKDFQVTLSKRAKRFCSHECIIEHKLDMRIEPEHIKPPRVRKKAVVTALGYASLVLFCFKRRWNYQGGYRERFKLFIRLARDAGWKGSIVKALQRKEPKWQEIAWNQ